HCCRIRRRLAEPDREGLDAARADHSAHASLPLLAAAARLEQPGAPRGNEHFAMATEEKGTIPRWKNISVDRAHVVGGGEGIGTSGEEECRDEERSHPRRTRRSHRFPPFRERRRI